MKKLTVYSKLKFYYEKHKLEIAFSLLFLFPVYRLLSLSALSKPLQFFFCFVLFCVIYKFRTVLVPRLFNSAYFQAFVYFLFFLEDYFIKHNFQFFLALCCLYLYIYYNVNNTFYLIIFFSTIKGFYNKIKESCLNPDVLLEKDLEKFNLDFSKIGISSPEELTWDYIVQFLSLHMEILYGFPIANRLPLDVSRRSFPGSSRRFMFTKALKDSIKKGAEIAKNHPEEVALVSGVLGGVGAAIVFVAGTANEKRKLDQEDQRLVQEGQRLVQEDRRIDQTDRRIENERLQAKAQISVADTEKLKVEEAIKQHDLQETINANRNQSGWFGRSSQETPPVKKVSFLEEIVSDVDVFFL